MFSQQLLERESREAAQKTFRSVEARHEGIKQIEDSVVKLVELMEDMQFLLQSQQEMINSIETHVDFSTTNISQGSKHVGKAMEYRKSQRKKASCICGLVLILLIILGCLLFFLWIQPTFLAAKKAGDQNGNTNPRLLR